MHAGKKVYLLLVMVLALTQGCGAPAQPPPPPDLKPVTYSENAMTPADRLEFYHLPEGSELFPVAWILYMESPKTKRPFIENLERFGLVPDPEGPLFEGTSIHVPVGVTIKEREGTAALRPLGLSRMVGVNCAACHVGQIEYGGKNLRIDGAPNMFDIVGFLSEIKDTAETTYKSPSKLWAYLRTKIKAGKARAEVATLDSAKEYDALKQGSSGTSAARKTRRRPPVSAAQMLSEPPDFCCSGRPTPSRCRVPAVSPTSGTCTRRRGFTGPQTRTP